MPSDDFAQLECVRVCAEGVAEMDGKQRLIFIPRHDVERIELRRGSGAERPWITAILGILVTGMGLAALIAVPYAILAAGRAPVKWVTAIVFVVPGWWLLDLTFRRRFFLLVHMRAGTRKLVFHKTKERRPIEEFLNEAKARFQYA